MSDDRFPGWHGTTILAVRRAGQVVVAGDGQVSVGQTVMKGTARKVRRLSPGGRDVVVGFAGSTADAFTLFERLEAKLEQYPGQLQRAALGRAVEPGEAARRHQPREGSRTAQGLARAARAGGLSRTLGR